MTRTQVAIVGAGPYGLSLAAHLRARRVPFRIFGAPFGTWRRHMPKGMLLKSEGFASNLSDPRGELTLRRFAAEHGHAYAELGLPVDRDVFIAYGDWFREHAVPEVEDAEVANIASDGRGFRVELTSGSSLDAARVVLATGFGEFAYIPNELRGLDDRHVSHTFDHASVGAFRDRDVAVVGAGQSALETVVLLHEAGARPQLIARCADLAWNPTPSEDARLTFTTTELGVGWKLKAYTLLPASFRHLPDETRARLVRTTLGPAGAWWLRDRLAPGIPQHTGVRVAGVAAADGGVSVKLLRDGRTEEVRVEHVIAATGYRVDVDRMAILSPDLRQQIRRSNGSPRLDAHFESSVRGLHFVGLAAANSFGPAMRFVFGAAFAANRLAQRL